MQTYQIQDASNPYLANNFFDHLGLPSQGQKLYEKLHQGFDYEIYSEIYKYLQFQQVEINTCLNFAPATVKRRKGKHFNLEESDRLYRLAEIINAALSLFEGNEEQAKHWLKHPVKALNYKRPVDMALTSAETEAALDLIGRLEHGIFS